MLKNSEIIETLDMIGSQHLDVRTITMGINLFDCISDSKTVTADRVYDKITRYAQNLVKTGDAIGTRYGVAVVNKRVSVTPVSLIGAASGGYVEVARALDRAAKATGIDFIGGYSAMLQKGMSKGEEEFINTIPEVLALTDKVCSSVNVASTRAGINMDAVRLVGKVIKKAAYLTRDNDGLGAAKFVAFANAVEDNPFMAGAFHGTGEADKVINVGVSGPGVVKCALEKIDGDLTEVAECIKLTAFKITRLGQLVAREASKMLDASFGIVDLSLAPTPAMGDSVAHVLEEMGLESVGACGTTAALALLNDAVKKGGIMASSHVGAEEGCLTLEKLEAMTAVCSVGIDMVAIPGDTPEEVVSALIADEAAIGVVNNKTTAVRVIPAYGKTVGDSVEFGGLLGRAPILKISGLSPERFISRGGRIPAPLHSNKN